MSATMPVPPAAQIAPAPGLRGLIADWSSDQQAFHVSWGKAMMWIFLLSDTFIFGTFLTGYMSVRSATTVPWPNPSEVFALHVGGSNVPLLLIAIMTFVLITSSGTMAMAVNCAYRRDRANAAALMVATAAFGEIFVPGIARASSGKARFSKNRGQTSGSDFDSRENLERRAAFGKFQRIEV